MIVVDTSVWIALLRDRATQQVERLLSIRDRSQILLTDLVLLELLQGSRDDRHAARIERDLGVFEQVAISSLELAPLAAGHYRRLRMRGITVRKTVDLIIASYCIAHGHHLLHQDRDFEPFAEHCGLLIA
ncbi:PIN domain-containing protein [Bosea sp. CS1GBMeth4]|uniref:type II toxin-antitoxin system VapC family toxin n=1 Tax=Bosea sp. CS1GBMeth4 TaxID=1892849 RepID=UPI0016442F49|nr:PIN domain-containing protein [Bosea sp. CS1GBMeth4]